MKSRGHAARIDHDGDDRLSVGHPFGTCVAMGFAPGGVIATCLFR
jgi:hypothetical protein